VDQEKEVDMAIDQAWYEPAAVSVDNSGPWRYPALSGCPGANDSARPHESYRVCHRRSAGTIPKVGSDDCNSRIGSWNNPGLRQTSAAGAQTQRPKENGRGKNGERHFHLYMRSWRWQRRSGLLGGVAYRDLLQVALKGCVWP
jgi:hypothetical protein